MRRSVRSVASSVMSSARYCRWDHPSAAARASASVAVMSEDRGQMQCLEAQLQRVLGSRPRRRSCAHRLCRVETQQPIVDAEIRGADVQARHATGGARTAHQGAHRLIAQGRRARQQLQ